MRWPEGGSLLDYRLGQFSLAVSKVAHLRDQGIDFAVFNAKALEDTDAARDDLLAQLTNAARLQGLKIDKSALAYRSGARNRFYGTPDLVRYLTQRGVPRWTHTIEV